MVRQPGRTTPRGGPKMTTPSRPVTFGIKTSQMGLTYEEI